MNELGRMRYGDSGIIIPNIKRKIAAEKAIAAIKEALPDTQISYGVIKDVLELADSIAYFSPLQIDIRARVE